MRTGLIRCVPDPLINTPFLPYIGYHDEFDRCWSNGTSIRMKNRRETAWLLASQLSIGDSRSSELTWIDRFQNRPNSAILTENFDHFAEPTYIYSAPNDRSTWNSVKTRVIWGYQAEKTFNASVTDRQTDGRTLQTGTGRRPVPHLRIALRCKNEHIIIIWQCFK